MMGEEGVGLLLASRILHLTELHPHLTLGIDCKNLDLPLKGVMVSVTISRQAGYDGQKNLPPFYQLLSVSCPLVENRDGKTNQLNAN